MNRRNKADGKNPIFIFKDELSDINKEEYGLIKKYLINPVLAIKVSNLILKDISNETKV